MPFAPADMYSATLSDYEHDEQRLGQQQQQQPTTSPSTLRINSTQFFSLAALLFVATGIQAYFAPRMPPYQHAFPLDALYDEDTLFSITRYLAYGVSDVLSPLMILSCTVAATGTLVRGLELVVQAAAFKGR